jgi:hypothetical protein
MCGMHRTQESNLFAVVVIVKQGCVQMDVSGATIQISTSFPVALCSHVFQCLDASSVTGILSQFMMAHLITG